VVVADLFRQSSQGWLFRHDRRRNPQYSFPDVVGDSAACLPLGSLDTHPVARSPPFHLCVFVLPSQITTHGFARKHGDSVFLSVFLFESVLEGDVFFFIALRLRIAPCRCLLDLHVDFPAGPSGL